MKIDVGNQCEDDRICLDYPVENAYCSKNVVL